MIESLQRRPRLPPRRARQGRRERRLATLEAAGELRHPVHHRDPRRHRRVAGRPRRGARGHRRQPPPPRPRAGGDRPELPAQGRHRRCTARRPARPTSYLEAIALARLILPPDVHLQAPPNLSDDFGVAARRRHRRLGRRLPGHRRPRQPRAPVARARPAARGHRGRAASRSRRGSRSTPSSSLEPERWLDHGLRFPVHGPQRRRGPRPRRSGRGLPRSEDRGRATSATAPRSSSSAAARPRGTRAPTPTRRRSCPAGAAGAGGRGRRGARRRRGSARSPARTRSSRCSRPAAGGRRRRRAGRRAAPARPSATPSPGSTTATSTTRTSARSSAGSAASRRARCRSTCAARPTCSRSTTSPSASVEAWELGATEVCLQGGIHPDFDGDYYLDVARAVKDAAPDIHVHGFTALEVTEGAKRLGEPLGRLPRAGSWTPAWRTLPGTAAEILDDEVRADPVPRQDQHRGVARGPPHRPRGRAALERHDHVRRRSSSPVTGPATSCAPATCRSETGGFTEFVPLPFVHMAAPIYLQRKARRGPDVPRGRADARRRPHRLPRLHRQHPGLVGEARRRRRAASCCRPASTTSAAR